MKKLLLLIALVLVAYVAWRWWHRAEVTRGQGVVFDRVWIDHLPKSEQDRFQLFVAVTKQPVGSFMQRTAWKGEWEGFRYQPRGDGQLDVVFPHDNAKARVSYRAWKCNEREFEYCLEMSGGKGARKYYSRRGWEIRSGDEAKALADRLTPASE